MTDARRGSESEDRFVWSDKLLDSLARAIHDVYRQAGQAQTELATGDASMAPWDELTDELRKSNRDQAAHILEKLEAIGCDVRPAGGISEENDFRLESDELELLAELEHRRWVDERRRNGWVQGSRDPLQKTTPYLVPWEELSEPMRDYDRMFVQLIPRLLRRHGYRVTRRTVP